MPCGLPVPVLVTVMVAVRVPAVDGEKVTPNWQLPPAGTAEPAQRLLTMANSDGFELVTDDTVTDVPPVLVSVTIEGALCEPTDVPGIVSAAGMESWPGGVVTTLPVPDSATFFVAPLVALLVNA